ncbi:C45 family autoproteolytic acyltransferase/hydrolase [Shewanella olleyana]|uniref:C45 family autoproteolytic acyltransferase/hydolase n=1 Tax=Shewanella olleyana TaxID=135626 RepID=UPI00200E62BF|nr:C45 family peptidase [Shewanella olleyana]MCL1065820.1 C45 family autoproteolytic acyltransferase/hydrolase [Shewanella olleyana]
MITSTTNLRAEFNSGKMFETNEEMLFVLQLSGSWYEMGQQYGKFAQQHLQPMWDKTVQPLFDKGLTTAEEAYDLFGKRVYDALSLRRKQYFQGVADSIGWTVEEVIVLDQSGPLAIYLGKLNSFSGCSSLSTWGENTIDGRTLVGRNMDWSELFMEFPVYLTVFNPTDGSNKIANVCWPGWHWLATGVNDKGVYTDLHDGTSMGGNVLSTEKPSFLHSVFDYLAESDNIEALSARFQASRTDIPTIWMLADKSGQAKSYENTIQENRKRVPEEGAQSFITVNTFLNPDWGLGRRETLSLSLRRLENLTDRHNEVTAKIDAAKMRDIFDMRLYNEDGTLKEKGGVTKPKNQDVDLTNYQTITDLTELEMWIKLPVLGDDWCHIDLKEMFNIN